MYFHHMTQLMSKFMKSYRLFIGPDCIFQADVCMLTTAKQTAELGFCKFHGHSLVLSQTSHLRKRMLKLSPHLSPPHRLSPFSTTFFSLFSRSLTTTSSVLTLPTRNPSGTCSLHLHLPPALTSPFCQHYSLLGLL